MVDASERHVVITGLMGAGKSTVGPLVAEFLRCSWTDSDAAIESQQGRTGRSLALAAGVSVLHELEADHLLTELGRPAPTVISAAPSVLDRRICLQELERSAFTVFLDVDPSVLEVRQETGNHRRSLLEPLATLTEMRARRTEAIGSIGGVVVECGEASPSQVAALVIRALES